MVFHTAVRNARMAVQMALKALETAFQMVVKKAAMGVQIDFAKLAILFQTDCTKLTMPLQTLTKKLATCVQTETKNEAIAFQTPCTNVPTALITLPNHAMIWPQWVIASTTTVTTAMIASTIRMIGANAMTLAMPTAIAPATQATKAGMTTERMMIPIRPIATPSTMRMALNMAAPSAV